MLASVFMHAFRGHRNHRTCAELPMHAAPPWSLLSQHINSGTCAELPMHAASPLSLLGQHVKLWHLVSRKRLDSLTSQRGWRWLTPDPSACQ